MATIKIDYGIDLGTTNSAIARMENGEPVIKKTDTLKDTMPSCISFNKKQTIQAGDSAMNTYKADKLRSMKNNAQATSNTFIEFKRTMGTDKKYSSSNMSKEYSSEELSAEVLKKLKSFITDEELKSIVVTVPAKFNINQKDATVRAAKFSGFAHCELLQEPIAAAMSYGIDAKSKNGFWLVFDFGGGTFDAALLRVEDGIMKVVDTDGNDRLGGKNIDYAIVDELIIPELKSKFSIQSFIDDKSRNEALREGLKWFAEDAKIQMSFNTTHNILSNLGDFPEDDKGTEIEIDLNVTEQSLEPVVKPFFQQATDICKEILKRNNLAGHNLDALILVGGPTYSPILRKMLKEQITMKVDTSIDPMTAVAKGAALFASTINISDEIVEQNRDKTKLQLWFGYEPSTVENEELVTVRILKDKTKGKIPDKVFTMIVRSDKAWDSGKVEIDEAGEVIEVKLNEGKANAFNVFAYNGQGDLIPSEPNEFTIIQGSKVGYATLPHHIGIEIKNRISSKVVFKSVKGLEKNQPIPAKGTANGLKTQKAIRPGMKEDFIKIPLYEGEQNAEGSRAVYNEYIYDVNISGEDLPKLLPEGSDVDLTISVDRSGTIGISAFFPYLEYTHELTVPRDSVQQEISTTKIDEEIKKAEQQVKRIKNENGVTEKEELEKVSSELEEIEKRYEQGKEDYDRKKDVLDGLRRNLRKLDKMEEATEWPKTEAHLKDEFYKLEKFYKEHEGKLENLNEDIIKQTLADFKEQIPVVIKEKNITLAKQMIEELASWYNAILHEAFGVQVEIYWLEDFHKNFDSHSWTDKNKARVLLNQGIQMINNNPSKQKLRGILNELFKLLPEDRKPNLDADVLTD